MSYGNAQSGEPINLQTLREELQRDASYALIKTNKMEIIGMVLPQRKSVEQHSMENEISVLCLKGDFLFNIDGKAYELGNDDWLYLEKGKYFSYSVKADTILLITIVF